MSKTILGLHHVTAITSSAPKICDFFMNKLGMHFIKRSANQDNILTYHLYFTDDMGEPGAIMTFFVNPDEKSRQIGNNEISRLTFRVPSDAALSYWQKRFDRLQVRYEPQIHTQFGAKYLNFYDFDGQQYALVSEATNQQTNVMTQPHRPWRYADVDEAHAIIGLGPVTITLHEPKAIDQVLTQILKAEKVTSTADQKYHLYEFAHGGLGAQIIIHSCGDNIDGVQGYGGVHHIAFTVQDDQALAQWQDCFHHHALPHSDVIDRYYFKSQYFRPVPRILFELATTQPGFFIDETYEEAGKKLALPPFLEPERHNIEAHLAPFDTK